MPKQLQMHNGEVRDHDDPPERCPECGKPLAYAEPRGDETAFVHRDDRLSDCFK